MIQPTHRILVVAHSSQLASALVAWLGDPPNELVLTNSYASAKRQLAGPPDVLITEIKLGAYNGLQLALRGQLAGIPTIVLGPADDGFEREAERLGATYVASDHLESDSLASALRHALDETHRLHPPVAEPAVSMTGGHVVH